MNVRGAGAVRVQQSGRGDLWERTKFAAQRAWKKELASYGIGGEDKGATAVNVGSKAAGAGMAFAEGSAKVVYRAGGRVAAKAGIRGGIKAVLGGTGVGAVVAFAPDVYTLATGFIEGWNEYGR